MKIDSIDYGQTTDAGAKRFLINLFVPTHGRVEVRSCEVTGSKWRNRTSFTDARGLEDIFAPSLVSALNHLLGKVTPEARVLALPDRAIEARGLVLGSIHIMSKYAEDGSAAIVLRFKHLVGNIYNAFAASFGMSNHVAETRDDLALGVLADLSLPLLDLCTFSEGSDLPEQARNHPLFLALANRAEEIRFQVELVKRYVDGIERAPVRVSHSDQDTALELVGVPT